MKTTLDETDLETKLGDFILYMLNSSMFTIFTTRQPSIHVSSAIGFISLGFWSDVWSGNTNWRDISTQDLNHDSDAFMEVEGVSVYEYTFPLKGQIGNSLGFEGHLVYVTIN